MYARISEAESEDPEIGRIDPRISRSFLDVVDGAWRECGFNSRSEFTRYALRDAVNHPEGAGLWRDLAISEAQFAQGEGLSSQEIEAKYEKYQEWAGKLLQLLVFVSPGAELDHSFIRPDRAVSLLWSVPFLGKIPPSNYKFQFLVQYAMSQRGRWIPTNRSGSIQTCERRDER